jgi:trans-2,3-dihydro-3-hydroxyanthranilate isomerase
VSGPDGTAALASLAAFDPFGSSGPSGSSAPPSSPGPSGSWRRAHAQRPRRYFLLDVFSERPFEGNQLAVFTDGRGIEGETMQLLARELKLSETVFMLPAEAQGDVRVRIFTPEAELPFAGHPVLGSGAVAAGALGREEIVLETGSGPVALGFGAWQGRVANGTMAQPIPTWERFEDQTALLAALGVSRSGLPVEIYCNGPRHLYVELESAAAVASLKPDLRALAELGEMGVSCFAAAQGKVKSRMFAPALGVPEDPATGSAAGPLAVHLARHGRIAFGEQIEISQGAEVSRPSLLLARAEGSAERIERVEVGGSAAIVARGEFWLP